MSAYENVDRQQQNVNKKTAAKFRAPTSSKLRRKQRKWRVLLSIGLLLPALAAVIGIVAWAISIEVSNSDRAQSQPLSSSNQQHRKLHQNQLQLPVAQKQHHFSPFRRQQPQQEEVAAAAQLSNVRQARTPEPEISESRAQDKATLRRRSEQQLQQEDSAKQTTTTTTKSESFNEERNSATSTLLLTNLGQVEAIRGSSAASAAPQQQTSTSTTTTTTTTTTAAPTAAVSTEDYVPVSSSTIRSTSSGTAAAESEGLEQQLQVTSEQQQEEEEEKFEADCEKSRHVDEDEEQDNDAQKMLMFMMMSPKNANHKSRFFSSAAAAKTSGTGTGTLDQRKLINRLSHLPAKGQQRKQSSTAAAEAAAAALAKQITTSLQQVEDPTGLVAHLSAEKRGSRLLKSDAKIAFLATNGAQAAGKHRYVMASEQQQQPRAADSAAEQVGSSSTSASSVVEPEVATVEPLPLAPEEERSSGSDNPSVGELEDSSAGASAGNLLNGSTSPPVSAQTTTTTPATSASKEPKPVDDELSFELIASAISTSLNQQQQQNHLPQQSDSSPSLKADLVSEPLDGDTSGDFAANESLVDNTGQAAEASPSSPDQVLIRRRTAGEHVAEVIDHIVERRKQQQAASSLHEQQRGPQIVVVAPVGGDSMKARSLIRLSAADEAAAASKEQLKVSIKNKAQVATSSNADPIANQSEKSSKSSTASKKDVILAKKQSPVYRYTASSRLSKSPLIGARLLGTADEQLKANVKGGSQQQPIKYSERVEVIEDDDSSAFLMKTLTDPVIANEPVKQQQQDQEETLQRRLSVQQTPEEENNNNNRYTNEDDDESSAASIHVSSHSGEPRSRSPRHELNPALVFERFAQQTIERRQQQQQQQQVNGPNQPVSVAQNNQLKLYSAEQLIRDHVLKSKSRPKLQVQVPLQNQMSNQQPAAPELQQQQQQKPQASQSAQVQQSSHQHQVKVIPTTFRPHFSSTTTTPTSSSTSEAPQQQQDARQSPMAAIEQQQAAASHSNGYLHRQQVPLVAGNTVRSAPALNHPAHQQSSAEAQMKPADSYQALESQQESVMYQQPLSSMSASPAQPVSQHQDHQQHHLYQESPSSSYQSAQAPGQTNNQVQQLQQQQLPMFADQEYNVAAHMAESVIQSIQRAPPSINMVNGQPTLISLSANQVPFQPIHQSHLEQLQQQPSSPQQALYLASQQFQNQQHLQHLQNNQQQQAFNQAAFLSRFANQHHNQMNSNNHAPLQQRQVIANRNGGEPAALVVPVKKSMIHPVAQMALRHLFSSMGQQAQVQEQQQSGRAAISSATAPQSGVAEAQVTGVAGAVPTDTVANNPLPGEDLQAAGSRQMRSLTVDSPAATAEQQVAAQSQQQQQQVISDQEVQESYGQMPAYHYGGGDHYNGGANNYQSDHDKKSKGLTFHFGGGPIGGGTQLITSPMGIFKHLMLPLMPNPLVHINGKVVFGVVLEKSTKIGSPPKKKYKFWGR